MTERPTAFYDDLAIEPDREFERVLRRRLDHDLRAVSEQQFTLPTDVEIDVALMPDPEPEVRQQNGRSRRSLIAVAAAIAASIAVGVVVDRLVSDDNEPPVATVPPTTVTPTRWLPDRLEGGTIDVPATATPTTAAPTTTEPNSAFQPDAEIAFDSMLQLSDVGADNVDLSRPVTLKGTVAAALPDCQRFASTVFESDTRPAWVRSRVFQMHTGADVAMQYLAVLPTEAQAEEMFDGMRDPDFLDSCVAVYRSVVPTVCCDSLPYWFPFFTGQELQPPTVSVDADDVWVRSWRGSWSGPGGENVSGGQHFLFGAIRMGRVVTLVDVKLEDDDGTTLATVEDFQRIVQAMAARIADAQAVS